MSVWGRELMAPDEIAYDRGIDGWLCREALPDEAEARAVAAEQVQAMEGASVAAGEIRLTAVLMRQESEVEANINGHEGPLMVECTARAKHPEPFWRVERTEPKRAATVGRSGPEAPK